VYAGISLADKEVVVAAPLLDAREEVVGVLYGEWPGTLGVTGGGGPDPLKLALIKVIACGVSAGLARQTKERDAALFEAFFSKSLSAKLRSHPNLLEGKWATVTILFCDVREYSTLSTRLDPGTIEKWLPDVLGELSQCVLDEDGVVVDYIGDEVMAMWGAPEKQEDQTDRAVRAGIAMLRALPALNDRWRKIIGTDIDLGVGIHRGEAQVGNCGTRIKFKYSALGDTVNRASRVQGMTKHLKCPLLVTEAARDALIASYPMRRVVCTRLTGIEQPVNLYEIAASGDDKVEFFARSEAAHDALEQALGVLEGEARFDNAAFSTAARLAGALLAENAGDGPLLLTLSRATEALIRDGRGCSKVWTPPGK
jgi:adenylate cyclase